MLTRYLPSVNNLQREPSLFSPVSGLDSIEHEPRKRDYWSAGLQNQRLGEVVWTSYGFSDFWRHFLRRDPCRRPPKSVRSHRDGNPRMTGFVAEEIRECCGGDPVSRNLSGLGGEDAEVCPRPPARGSAGYGRVMNKG
jgi:hypothetical protein